MRSGDLHRLGLVILGLCSCVVLSAQATGGVEAIRAALRARNFAEAVERSRAAMRPTPNDPQVWTLNGLALVGIG
jgi:Flp pilus assembly protein TadD